MTKPSNISGIEAATHRPWEEWVTFLETSGASELSHKQIAELARGKLEGTIDSAGWWAQSVAVAYEQHIGRRAPGQKNDGTYEVSVTRLIPGTKEDVFALWVEAHGDTSQFDDERIDNVRTSVTDKRCYWRADFLNGSRLALAVEQKSPDKAMGSITHTKLGSQQEKDSWQRFWRETLDKL